MIYPLVMTNIAMENDHQKFLDLPTKIMIFHIFFVCLPGRVTYDFPGAGIGMSC